MTTTIKNYKQICKKVKLICTDFIDADRVGITCLITILSYHHKTLNDATVKIT